MWTWLYLTLHEALGSVGITELEFVVAESQDDVGFIHAHTWDGHVTFVPMHRETFCGDLVSWQVHA